MEREALATMVGEGGRIRRSMRERIIAMERRRMQDDVTRVVFSSEIGIYSE